MSMFPDTFFVRAWDAGKTDEESHKALMEVSATVMTNDLVEGLLPHLAEEKLTPDLKQSWVGFTQNCRVAEVNGPIPLPAVLLMENNKRFVVLKSELFSVFHP